MKNLNKDKILFFLIAVLFGTIGPVVRAIGLPSHVVANLRAWIASVALILFLVLTKKKVDFALLKQKALPLAVCGVLMAVNWIGLFEAYNYTTIATATVCYYMMPIIVFFLSPLVLGEKFTAKHLVCALVALAGMVLVSGMVENGIPELSEIKGILWALLGAVCYSGIILINKKNPEVAPFVRTTVMMFLAAVFSTPYVLLRGGYCLSSLTLKGTACLLLLAVGLTAFTYMKYFDVLTKIPARTAAIFSYLDPVVAVLISVFVMGEPITLTGIVGSVLIIGSALVSEC